MLPIIIGQARDTRLLSILPFVQSRIATERLVTVGFVLSDTLIGVPFYQQVGRVKAILYHTAWQDGQIETHGEIDSLKRC